MTKNCTGPTPRDPAHSVEVGRAALGPTPSENNEQLSRKDISKIDQVNTSNAEARRKNGRGL